MDKASEVITSQNHRLIDAAVCLIRGRQSSRSIQVHIVSKFNTNHHYSITHTAFGCLYVEKCIGEFPSLRGIKN